PTRPLGIRAERTGEELISFENPAGQTKWHFNQNLGGNNPGFNIVETGVADGRLFLQAGGNVGIGTTAPSAKLNIDPQGPGGIVIGNPSTGQGGFTSLLMDISAASGGNARIQAIKASGTAWGETDINPDGGNVGVGLRGARTQFHVLGRIATGLDFNSAGSVTFFPPDGFAWFHIDNGPAGGRPIGMLRFSHGNSPGDHILMTIDQSGNVIIPGTLSVNGAKHFVQEHPTDPTQEIVYTSLEGGEAGTYTRGTWKLEDGKAVIELPEHFSMVTSEDGLTVQLTPRGEWLQLYVAQLTTGQLIVQEAQGKSGQFDYLIQGVRKGYEHHEVIREKR
ncbi:MAG TPA: hypothetical protein VFQ30_09430, partial [Ktedonobacteraceae bacterium]|nr:hypothetical protein [Ktedonobacteraceae bacterium]